ncbi:MAG: tryptophan-rich sensory protein [Gammaproteobacteria bacterium]|nr:tryptophan-rich sensory protein [Gammaproteobacteria bacterium]
MTRESAEHRPSPRRAIVYLLGFLVITFGAAAFGAQFMPGPWYAALVKPAWTPPNWLFGPVWTVLYVLIALSAWLVWRAQPRLSVPLGLWFAQLGLNAIWSWLFFGLERPGLAAIDIVALLVAIIATAVAFARASRTAAFLLLPYALWVGFATALNIAIWRLNG